MTDIADIECYINKVSSNIHMFVKVNYIRITQSPQKVVIDINMVDKPDGKTELKRDRINL